MLPSYVFSAFDSVLFAIPIRPLQGRGALLRKDVGSMRDRGA